MPAIPDTRFDPSTSQSSHSPESLSARIVALSEASPLSHPFMSVSCVSDGPEPAGMSAVFTDSEITPQRPHWLAGAPGFEPGNGGIASCGAGTAPADLTVTGLAKALPYSWAEQESNIGFPQ